MKKGISYFFLVLIGYSLIGYSLSFYAAQSNYRQAIKQKIRNNISENELEKILLTENVRWINKKEFRLNGKLYDIVKTKTENGKAWLYAINDSKEELLIEKFTRQTNEKARKQSFQVLQFNPVVVLPDGFDQKNIFSSHKIHFYAKKTFYSYLIPGPEPAPPAHC